MLQVFQLAELPMFFPVGNDFLRCHLPYSRQGFQLLLAGGIDIDQALRAPITLVGIQGNINLHALRHGLRHVHGIHIRIGQYIPCCFDGVIEMAALRNLIDPGIFYSPHHIDKNLTGMVTTGLHCLYKRRRHFLPAEGKGIQYKKRQTQKQECDAKAEKFHPSPVSICFHRPVPLLITR